jgi:hypothetical protein
VNDVFVVPEEFLCPITMEVMKDPVIASGISMSIIDINIIID